MKSLILILVVLFQVGCASDNYYYQNNKKMTLTPSSIQLKSGTNIDYYQNSKGIVLGVNDQIVVKLNNNYTIEPYLTKYNLILQKTIGKSLYLLQTTNKNLTLEISNQLYEEEGIKFAHPNFLKKVISR